MMDGRGTRRFRFAEFELDERTGELRRNGLRVRLHAQPSQVLLMLVERPGELLTREEIERVLWPEGTFVDAVHGVNSCVNRLREALGDKASQPRFVETLARRGYRFVAPVDRVAGGEAQGPAGAEVRDAPAVVAASAVVEPGQAGGVGGVLARPDDLPRSSRRVTKTLFVLLQVMYAAFYVGALANLGEIGELLSPLPFAVAAMRTLIVTAALLIPVRAFLASGAMMHPPGMRARTLRLWPVLLVLDWLWALSPCLLLHHIPPGMAIACIALLAYAPFAQRSLVLMGAMDAR